MDKKKFFTEYEQKRRNMELHAGLLKSTLGTLFISLGVSTGLYSFIQPDVYMDGTLYLAIILVFGGFIIYYFGDVWKISKQVQDKKEEHEYIEKRAEEIAEKLVEKQMNKIKKELCDE